MTRNHILKAGILPSSLVAALLVTLAPSPACAAEEKEEKVVTEVAVHTAKVEKKTMHGFVVAYGVVETEPASAGKPAATVRVISPVAGIITEANCYEGQRVDKGTTLFKLDTRTVDVLIEKAKLAIDFAEKNLDRQKKLAQVEGTSQKALQDAEQLVITARNDLSAAQLQRVLMKIDAPISGIITRVNAKAGEAADTVSPLAEITDLDRLVVVVNVPSAELPLIKVGQPVEVYTGKTLHKQDTNSAPVFIDKLAFIAPQIDPKTDTAFARVNVSPKAGLRPGQFVSVRIVSEERPNRLAVPVESVVKDGDGNEVIAIVEGTNAKQLAVKTGLRENGFVEVEGEGVKEGLSVVTVGSYGLPKETKVRLLDAADKAEKNDKTDKADKTGK